jgi:hypothetical protein
VKNGVQKYPDNVDTIPYTNATGGTLAMGAPVAITSRLWGIVLAAAAGAATLLNGATGTVATRGQFSLPKAAGGGSGLAVGTLVTISGGNVVAWAGSIAAAPIGRMAVASADADTAAIVDLNEVGERIRTLTQTANGTDATNGFVDIPHGLSASPTVLVGVYARVGNTLRAVTAVNLAQTAANVRVTITSLANGDTVHLAVGY